MARVNDRALIEALRPLVAELIAEELEPVLAALQRSEEPSPWMTVREAAEYVRVSESTMRQWVSRDVVLSYLIEGRRLLRREDLDACPLPSRANSPGSAGTLRGATPKG
jgi:excisionase family DNA binding protein